MSPDPLSVLLNSSTPKKNLKDAEATGMAKLHSLLTKRKSSPSFPPTTPKRHARAKLADTPSRTGAVSKPPYHSQIAESRATAQAKYYRKATEIRTQQLDEKVDIFPFFAMPTELRLAVYFELLVTDNSLVPTWRGPRKTNKRQKKMYVDILLTCKLCCKEGVAVLYGENVFDFGEICNRPNNFSKAFVNHIGLHNASLIRIIFAEYSAAAKELSHIDTSSIHKCNPIPPPTLTVAYLRSFLSTFNISLPNLRLLAISIMPYGFDQASMDLMRIQAVSIVSTTRMRVRWLDAKNEPKRLSEMVDQICEDEEGLARADYWKDVDPWIGFGFSPSSSGREWIVYEGVRGKEGST
ncbi:hypothetical protein N0V90_003963 [Kalmusia sp. IMI 367209]|nr:hypothetical protein N0V90_003963 [Kalmusia sp. IMI 367209]